MVFVTVAEGVTVGVEVGIKGVGCSLPLTLPAPGPVSKRVLNFANERLL